MITLNDNEIVVLRQCIEARRGEIDSLVMANWRKVELYDELIALCRAFGLHDLENEYESDKRTL
jgi:hypothetical protein